MNKCLILLIALLTSATLTGQSDQSQENHASKTIPGAARFELYLPMLLQKRVAIFANHTTMVNDVHLVDALKKRGIRIVKIFAPEHGFRGTADAGAKIDNTVDAQTGIPVISLYGKKRKPSDDDLKDVDIMVFDIQDVGVRFYTYISSLQEYMEAAIKNDKPLIILDRPNPNGFYVDGPVLDRKFTSFVGMQPVPIVYGMTIGEYAKMLIGEKWLDSSVHNKLHDPKKVSVAIIACENYDHKSKYELPVRPSPNLPDMQSIYLYPSTCLFEGTVLSEGRGTEKPFQIFGHPSLPQTLYAFTPVSREGATNPKLKNKKCYGWNLSGTTEEVLKKVDDKVQLKWVLEAYKLFPQKDSFFLRNNFFNRLAGNNVLMQQIKNGVSETDIRNSWKPGLETFKKIRKKYLLYNDFE
jgi:uncharacterized protein YbbC (DUF1343 family)